LDYIESVSDLIIAWNTRELVEFRVGSCRISNS